MTNNKLTISGMPQMSAAFNNWMVDVCLVKVTQTIVEGYKKEMETTIKFKGTVQPLTAQKLMLKPEALRSFIWLQIHCFQNQCLNLKTNDLIKYKDKKYKVMGILDYSLNNYIEYHVVEDFADAG